MNSIVWAFAGALAVLVIEDIFAFSGVSVDATKSIAEPTLVNELI